MEIKYCHEQCQIGQAASKRCLDTNNSAVDAAIDFGFFVSNCSKTCPKATDKVSKEK